MDVQSLRVALVYDRVNTPHGGAERVLLSLHTLFPQAPLFTSIHDPSAAKWANVFDVRTSFLQNIPFARQKHRELLALMPAAFSQLDLRSYDIVISVTSAEAKGVTVGPNTLHISYLLTPPRYLWSHTHEYQTGVLKPVRAFLFSLLRRWDYKVSQKINAIIPISGLVKRRAEKYYQRNIEAVIYPPFLFTVPKKKPDTFHHLSDFVLIVGRLVGYKKIQEVVQTCITMKKTVVVIGDGPEAYRLQQKIHELDPKQQFVHWYTSVTDEELISAYSAAKVLIQPAEEDFGITVLEAQACGTPVIVNKRSGAAETIIPEKTGLILEKMSQTALQQTISQIEQYNWNSAVIQTHVAQYNDEVFQHQFLSKVNQLWLRHHKKGSYE